ncbi:MAG: hypothetical protein Q8O72_09970 [Bacteroidales bacterium]|nr:hypothetical protein [Bacteroidales bacterium]
MKNATNPQLIRFIDEHTGLFWYTPTNKKHEVSEQLLLETILNYATFSDSLQLFDLLGYKHSLNILRSLEGRKKMNYYPELYHFYKLFLEKNA